MAEKFQDQEFLDYVVKALVDDPNGVSVNRKVDEMGVLLTLKLAPADMGKIIGRAGNTAKAIRTLLRVVGLKNRSRVNLKIEEPEGGLARAPRADAYGQGAAAEGRAPKQSSESVMDELKF